MKQNTVLLLLLLSIISILIVSGCENNGDDDATETEFIDHGFIPAEVKIVNCPFQSAISIENWVFIATNDGLWKNNLTTKEWSRAGLEGKTITCIFKHPSIDNKLFAGTMSDSSNTDKPLHLSSDGGTTWVPVDNPIFDELEGKYENFTCIAVRPDNPKHIFANLESGPTIAVSTDGGMNWTRMNNKQESYFGYTSNIVFRPNHKGQIFQSSESPLDFAWLGSYDINASNPVLLTNFTKLIDNNTWGNRRPNELQTYSFKPDCIYVGQEGALSKVTGTTNKFIFKSDNNNFPYSYIYGIWVNPHNTNHIVFGGALNNSEQPMSLYETFDEGDYITRFEDKFGFENPEVREIVHTNSYPAIILNDSDANQVKLILYKYD